MCSNPIVWGIGSTTGLDPDQRYAIRGDRWAEPSPVACPNGHRLGPNRVLVGTIMCQEVERTGCHRTYTCRTCYAEIVWPPANPKCRHRAFGVTG